MSDRIQIRMSRSVQPIFEAMTDKFAEFLVDHRRERSNETVYNMPSSSASEKLTLSEIAQSILNAEAPEDGRTARTIARIAQQLLEAGGSEVSGEPEVTFEGPRLVGDVSEAEAEAEDLLQEEFVHKLESAGIAQAFVAQEQEVNIKPQPQTRTRREVPPESERAQAQLAALFYRKD